MPDQKVEQPLRVFILIYSRCSVNQRFSVFTMFLWLWIHGNISHRGVLGGDCDSLVQVSPPSCSAVECKMAVVGTGATMGLSLWSAAVGMTGNHWETWAGWINTSTGVAALPPASDPSGQTALWQDLNTTRRACIMKKRVSLHSSGDSCGGKLIEIHIWRITQPLTHFDPQKQIPPSSHQAIFYLLHPIISINHPPTSFPVSSLHPAALNPPSQVALSRTLWRTIELNWRLLSLSSEALFAVFGMYGM